MEHNKLGELNIKIGGGHFSEYDGPYTGGNVDR